MSKNYLILLWFSLCWSYKFSDVDRSGKGAIGFFGLGAGRLDWHVIEAKEEIDGMEVLFTIDCFTQSDNSWSELRNKRLDDGSIGVRLCFTGEDSIFCEGSDWVVFHNDSEGHAEVVIHISGYITSGCVIIPADSMLLPFMLTESSRRVVKTNPVLVKFVHHTGLD